MADATLEKKSGEYGLESLTTNYSGDSQTEYTDYNKSDAAIVRLSEGSATVVIDGIDGVIGASNAGTPRPKITGPVGTRSAQKPRRIWLIAAVAALVCLLGAAGCWLIFGLPVAHDPDAGVPRRYPLVNVSLRTTPMAGGDFNKICVVPYGAELICYENDGMWSRVKYVPADPTQPIREGYAASTYLLDSADFHRLHDIFANDEARQVIETSKCRKALLKYFKDNGYWGVKPPSTEQPLPDPYPEWQVYVTPGDKPNEVYFKRISNPQSRYTDFAVVLRRRGSEARGTRLLYFTFDDDEAAHLMGEMGLYGLTRIDSFSKSAGSSEVTFRALSDSKEYGGYFVFLLGHTFRHNCGSEDEDPGIAMMSFNHMEDLKE